MDLLDKLSDIMPDFILCCLTLLPFFILWLVSKILFKRLQKKVELKNPVIIFAAKIANISIIIIAIITLLSTFGVDVSAIIAGLGLTGFALGFALKDVLSSCIAGMLILFYRPFKINSTIRVMGVEGKVIDIDMRYTTLQDKEGKHLIPSSKLISEKITILKN